MSTFHDVVNFWVDALWHHLFHPTRDTLLEHGRGELFLRCTRCGLRSPGVRVTGQLRALEAVAAAAATARPVLAPVLAPEPEPAWVPELDPHPAPVSAYLHH